MSYQLDFGKLVNYNNGEDGIILEAEIRYSETSIKIPAKIDTGAAYSIFERHFGVRTRLEHRKRNASEIRHGDEQFLRLRFSHHAADRRNRTRFDGFLRRRRKFHKKCFRQNHLA